MLRLQFAVFLVSIVAVLGFQADRPHTHAVDVPILEEPPSSQYLSLLPDGETKRRFILDCAGCHQFDARTINLDGRRKTHDEWLTRTNQMLAFAGAQSAFPIMAPSRDAAATADWLVEHLGDGTPITPLPTHTTPAATKAVQITEYDYPARLPHDLALLDDGRILITGMLTGQMHILDPATGDYEAIPIPGAFANPRALTVDDEGWWILLGGPKQIAHYDPASDAWRTYDIGMYPHSIERDDFGRIWFNGHFTKDPELIGFLDPLTGEVETYEVPTEMMDDGGSTIPYGLRLGPDGILWATQLVGSRLIRFDTNTEEFTLYDLPTSFSGPRRPDIAPDGTVWIPEFSNNRLTKFDPTTEQFTDYELPIRDALPYIVRVDAARNHIWIGTAAADAILRFDLATEQVDVHPRPTRGALIRHMVLDAASGDLWVAYSPSPEVAPKIARIEL